MRFLIEKELKLSWKTIIYVYNLKTIMSSEKKSHFFFQNVVAPKDNLSLIPLKILSFSKEQIKPLFTSRICFHPFCLRIPHCVIVQSSAALNSLGTVQCLPQQSVVLAIKALNHVILTFSRKPWVRTSSEVPENVYSLKTNCVAVRECGTCEKCKGSSFHASIKPKVSNTDWKHCVGQWKEA